MTRKRDFQRSRVYNSEFHHSHYKTLSIDKMSIAECRDYIERIMRSRWWKSRMPNVWHLNLKDGRGTRRARGGRHGDGIKINLPRWARHPIVILHEIAHTITPKSRYIAASHGRQFCSNYLALIKRWVGHEAWREMKDHFKKGRVKYRRKATA